MDYRAIILPSCNMKKPEQATRCLQIMAMVLTLLNDAQIFRMECSQIILNLPILSTAMWMTNCEEGEDQTH